jgi:hypothetical protein
MNKVLVYEEETIISKEYDLKSINLNKESIHGDLRKRILPKELLIYIFQFNEKSELFQYKLVNKSFRESICDDIIWKDEYMKYQDYIIKTKEKRKSLSGINIINIDEIKGNYFNEFLNIKKQLIEYKEKNRLKKIRDESKRRVYLFFSKYTRPFSIIMTFIFYISLFLTFCKKLIIKGTMAIR